jgi:hypothetical protein
MRDEIDYSFEIGVLREVLLIYPRSSDLYLVLDVIPLHDARDQPNRLVDSVVDVAVMGKLEVVGCCGTFKKYSSEHVSLAASSSIRLHSTSSGSIDVAYSWPSRLRKPHTSLSRLMKERK